MGWLDKVKQGMDRAREEAGEMAAIGKLKVEIRALHGKMEDVFKAIGAKVFDLSETGTRFPEEIAALCRQADALADAIKAKEAEMARLRAAS
ncbi:MAG: hypothetical protein QN141_03445 [Armatimonadota bacterium]|nr:hypothetical protein [Armatimonadota bacterium]MDR7451398.1 hypothetical protein [Armatimonadota bacterium]MDR7466452.1 hypothetical protein [Armatimonadota bacterium]MDR7493174.1 hypothetical protein [Armatimonadota bacterium]MDR7499473.1 hypothetical protein [Armatimonadota bacterium]